MHRKQVRSRLWLLALSLWLAGGLMPVSVFAADVDPDRLIHVTIVHMNDVYEITPVSGGKEGGLARVATVIKALKKQNPNTIVTHAGDIFSPSAMGTARVDGEPLAGAQMVAVLNQLGGIYATFGNHEFDLKKDGFYKRLAESQFTWISSNVRDANGSPFPRVADHKILTFRDPATGKRFTIGIFGLTLDVNQPGYVRYRDVMKTAAAELKALKKTDFQLALTHLAIDNDEKLDEAYPPIDLILGGHEHVNYQRWRGNFTPILKADANVRSLYVVDLSFDPATGKTTIRPRLMPITDAIPEDPAVKRVVDAWQQKAFAAFRAQGFDPDKVVGKTDEALDGLEADVRSKQTNLTRLIADAMLASYPQANLSLYNSGSIRVDDTLPPGPISEYDVLRILPFGGDVALVKIKGKLLAKILNIGAANKDGGGFLQYANVAGQAGGSCKKGSWKIGGAALDPQRSYKVAIADFLLTGKEQGLGFLTPDNPDITVLDNGKGNDIRGLVIKAFQQRK